MQPTLAVDLKALCSNYRLLRARHERRACAAVVKANAYGLGVSEVSKALWNEGCREFFVATLAEAIELRTLLPQATIAVFNGLHSGEENDFLHHKLYPVLNNTAQAERWLKASDSAPAILHVDTGMTRLGFTHSELMSLVEKHSDFASKRVALLMSHLACANDPIHRKNSEQLARFSKAKKLLPNTRASLCNSSGLFLDADFHYDLARPGCALYGINPTERLNPMQQVATLSAPILQVRTLDRDEAVGYGATYNAKEGNRIAITALGYADGWMRCLSNKSYAYINGRQVPIAGRISMDMIALDVSALPAISLDENARAEFINLQQPVDAIAKACNTIGYEVFTRLGRRVERKYLI
jgi:alanine racemase